MGPPVLSTTALLALLNDSREVEFVHTVVAHLTAWPEDHVSALKALKTLAFVLYERSLRQEGRQGLVNSAVECTRVIASCGVSNALAVDVIGALFHVLSRLEQEKELLLMAPLCDAFQSILGLMQDTGPVEALCYKAYVLTWNFATVSEQKAKEDDLPAVVKIINFALHCQLACPKSDKFSLPKIIGKAKSISRVMAVKTSSTVVRQLLADNLDKMLEHPVVKAAGQDTLWEVWSLALEFRFRTDLEVDSLIGSAPKPSGSLAALLQFVRRLRDKDWAAGQELIIVQPASPPLAILLINIILDVHQTSPDCIEVVSTHAAPAIFQHVASQLIVLCEEACKGNPSGATLATKIYHILEGLEVSRISSNKSGDLCLIRKLFSLHEATLEAISNNPDGTGEKAALSWLSHHGSSLGDYFTEKKQLTEAEEFLGLSCRLNAKLFALDLGVEKVPTYRIRARMLAEIQLNLKKFQECLASCTQSLLYLMALKLTDSEQRTKLVDSGRLWTSAKLEWLRSDPEKNGEVQGLTIVSMVETSCSNFPPTPTPELVKLLMAEIQWYRGPYSSNSSSINSPDLSQSRVNAMNAVLELCPGDDITTALVLIEQAWIFALGGNPEDMATGLTCCQKAATLLERCPPTDSGRLYLGVCHYWKFMCQHKIYQSQIVKELEEESRRQAPVERKERDGYQEEERYIKDDGTPSFSNLSLSVEEELVGMLQQALASWQEMVGPLTITGDWLSKRTFLDIVTAVCWQLELLGRPSCRPWQLLRQLGQQLVEDDYVIMAAVRLLLASYEENKDLLQEVIDKSAKLEDSKLKANAFLDVPLCLAEIYLKLNQHQACRDLLEETLGNKFVQLKLIKSHLIASEARILASKLRMRPGEWVKERGNLLATQGPLELGLDAMKLVSVALSWHSADQRIAGCRSSAQLWLEPRLIAAKLASIDQLTAVFSHISAARELRAYIKEGLWQAQSSCLALRTASLLVSLARAQLLCDDEEQAQVQINGISSILALDLGKKCKVRRDVDEDALPRLPGQQPAVGGRDASPGLWRADWSLPDFLRHTVTPAQPCSCFQCSSPLFHRILLDSYNIEAQILFMRGERRAGGSLYKLVNNSLAPQLRLRTSLAAAAAGLHQDQHILNLQVAALEGLLWQTECYAWCQEFHTCLDVVKAQRDLLRAHPQLSLLRPALVMHSLELHASVQRAIQEQEAGRLAKLASAAEQLRVRQQSCDSHERASTPSRPFPPLLDYPGAPSKRYIPSLGVGDPSGLAKDMEKLDLYSDKCDEDAPVATEPVKLKASRVARLPRLLRAAELVRDEDGSGNVDSLDDNNDIQFKRRVPARGLPRLVVTADTPRKFFKSKTAEHLTAAAAVDAPAAAATPSETQSSRGGGKLKACEAISIYTDDTGGTDRNAEAVQHTPQQQRVRSSSRTAATGATTASRTGRSTRKKAEESAGHSEPPSAAKPARRLRLQEEEAATASATKRSTRKAVSRL